MIRKAGKDDVKILVELALLMWGEHTAEELTEEFLGIISKDEAQFFIK